MKYSTNYERDFNWYLAVRALFNFDGSLDREIQYDKNGVSAKEAFYLFDSQGKMKPTKHPNILRALFKTKGSVNFHIKMYAEGRADCTLIKQELIDFCNEINAPSWFYEAVERQKLKYYKI